jgi:isoleucyl-tRNA synthetase
VARVAAPLLPFVTEEIYRGLTGERSVHLTDWPDATALPADDDLTSAMDRVRDVCSAALSIRKANGLRVRMPLASLTLASPGAEDLVRFADIIKDEVNVKDVTTTTDPSEVGTYVLEVYPAALGPRLGPDTQRVIRAQKAGDWSETPDGITAGGVALQPGEYGLRWVPAHQSDSVALPGNQGIVRVDTALTPGLEAEGVARDLVRAVQNARRDAGLRVSDRIHLGVRAAPDTLAQVQSHEDFVRGETLALDLRSTPDAALAPGEFRVEVTRA